jgi:AraC-like DNA-binding protein
MYEHIKFLAGGRFTSRGEWKHPSRTIDSHELILVLQGTVPIFAGDHTYYLTPGQMLHIRPGVAHGGTEISTEPVIFYWLHFIGETDSDFLPLEFTDEIDFGRTVILCKQLLHCANAPEYPTDCADYFMRLLLFEVNVQRPESTPLCASVEEWIRINCDRHIRVSDIAAHFGLNVDYLSRVFSRNHPEGLKRYLDAVRCQQIKQDLASTDLSLQALAQKYGFSDYKYFLKYFRFHEGMTPTQYRQAYHSMHTNWK